MVSAFEMDHALVVVCITRRIPCIACEWIRICPFIKKLGRLTASVSGRP